MLPNMKRLTVVLVVLLVGALSVHGVHSLQQGRRVEILVRTLEKARASGDPRSLISALRRYLSVRPEDRGAKTELLDLLVQHAHSHEEFVDAYYQIQSYLRENPNDATQREKAIRLALQLDEYQDVLTSIEFLATQMDLTAQMLVWKATAQQKRGDIEGAIKTFRSAIDKNAAQIEAYIELATILRRNVNAVEESQYWIKKLTEANPKSAAAHLAQARYYLDIVDLPAALAAVEAALVLDGSREEKTDGVLLWSDIMTITRQRTADNSNRSWEERDEEIAQRLREAWEADPGEAQFASKLAALALKRNKPDEAEQLLRKGLAQAPGDPLLQWELADLAITRGRREEAQQLIAELTASGVKRGLIEYLRGRLFLQDERWHDAEKSFLNCRGDLASSPRLTAQAEIFLAQCYAELGDHDLRVTAASRAVRAQPFFVAARQHLSQALLAVGRVDEALLEYRTMLELPDAPAYGWTAEIGWATVSKVLIIRNLSMPASERNWDNIDPVLQSLAEAAPDSIEVALLRAEVTASQSRVAEARDVLVEFKEKGRSDVRWWVAMINLSLRESNLDAADELLRQAIEALGEHVELRMLEARLAVYRSEDGYRRLAEIAQETVKWPPKERVRLLYELAAFYSSLGRAEDAETMYDEIIKLTPQDIRVWLYKFDSAMNRDDLGSCRRYMEAMQRIEGRDGSYSLLAEALLVLRNEIAGRSTGRRDEARQTLATLRTRRPRWARVWWAMGVLDDLEGWRERAAENFLRAFELGDRSPELVRRALNLLHALHRYDAAEEMIHRWEQTPNAPILPEINRMAAEISLERQNPEQALMRAQRAVSRNSLNYQDHLWLGRIHRSCGKLDEAETEFRTAVRLAPEATEVWVALVGHLLHEDRSEDAEAVIARIPQDVPLKQQSVILANCLEILGKTEEAESEFQRAVENNPDDLKLLHDAAEFFRRINKPVESERYWRRLVSLSTNRPTADRCTARRGLARVLAFRGDYPRFLEALTLVNQNLDELPLSTIDWRAKATLLAMRGDPAQRRESAELFAKLAHDEPLTIQDQSLLATLHELNGDLNRAHEIWQVLVAAQNTNPVFLARYVSVLLKRNVLSDAEIWLERLRNIAPDWQPTLELQAKLWLEKGKTQEGKTQQVVQLFEDYVNRAEDDAQRAKRAVQSAEALERTARTELRGQRESREQLMNCAEEHFRLYCRLDPSKQHVLAGFLARTNRPVEAMQLFEASWDAAPPALISSLIAASLPYSDPSPQLVSQAIDAISRHMTNPVIPGMLNDLAVLEEQQQNFDRAEQYYRQTLTHDPDNVAALNNLAFLLALQNRKLEEATQMIDKAFSLSGPTPALLDTRAQVALAAGRLEQAKSDREAVVRETSTAAAWFRLALVYQELKDRRKLRDAAIKVQNGYLEPGELHFLERRHLESILSAAKEAV